MIQMCHVFFYITCVRKLAEKLISNMKTNKICPVRSSSDNCEAFAEFDARPTNYVIFTHAFP